MQFKDYYQILGVDEQAGTGEIKSAYRKLARRYHPDVSREADANERFQEIVEAYEVLKDDGKRSKYNQLKWYQGQGSGASGYNSFNDFLAAAFGHRGNAGGQYPSGRRQGFSVSGVVLVVLISVFLFGQKIYLVGIVVLVYLALSMLLFGRKR